MSTFAPRGGFSGAILAGGASSRFGSDKARALVEGEAMLARVARSLEAAGERFIVSDRAYDEFPFVRHPDDDVGVGPVRGVRTALRVARAAWVGVAACDLPFLTPEYWELLLERRTERPGAVAVVVEGEGARLEPLAALYRKEGVGALDRYVAGGGSSLHGFVRSVPCVVIPVAEVERVCGARTLRNVNRGSDVG